MMAVPMTSKDYKASNVNMMKDELSARWINVTLKMARSLFFLIYCFHAASQGHSARFVGPMSQNAIFKDELCDGNIYFCDNIDPVY